ncbi:MAG TPA: hypothetical protein GXZ58_09470 [Bacilli bacterium]|nr:hypothetical protein [Bacilli bacterium]
MKILLSILFSSVLILGGCGATDTEQDTAIEDPPNGDVQDELPEEETEAEENIDGVQEGSDSENRDPLMFTYDPIEVKEFELQIELLTNEEWSYDFDRGANEAEIEYENGSDSERNGAEVFTEIEALLGSIQIDHERSLTELIDDLLSYLEIDRADLKELDVQIATNAGEKLGFKYHLAETGQSDTIDEFDMDIEFVSRDNWEYEYDLRDQDFSVEYDNQDNLTGQAAQEEMERILSEVTINLDQSIGELKAAFLASIAVDQAELEKWSFEVEFEDRTKIAARFDRSN